MGRYTIVKSRFDMWLVMEGTTVLYKFASLDQAQRKIEALEWMDVMREAMTPY